MSRKAPREFLATVMGEVYTLHFVPSFKHAKHYTGWAAEGRVPRRVLSHALGRGANLTKQQIEAGGTWVVADVEPGTHDRETQLKERGASRRCRVCKAQRAIEAGRITPEQAMEQWASASVYERGLLRQLFGLAPEAKPDLPSRQGIQAAARAEAGHSGAASRDGRAGRRAVQAMARGDGGAIALPKSPGR